MRPPLSLEYVAAQRAESLRALTAADREHVVALFERLSPRSRYLRYLAPVRSLSERVQRRLVTIDHSHEAVGAFEGGVLVGVAHWFRSVEDPSRAEISVEVADSHHRRGIGGRLLAELADRARDRGIAQLTATVLRENAAVIGLLRQVDRATVVQLAGTEMTVSVDLARPSTAGPAR
jgi:L-amino acid N-acyltransferase YncA